MATNTFTERIKIMLQGAKKAASDGKKVEKGLKGIQKAALAAGGSFFAAQGIINGMKHLMTLSLETEKVGQAFTTLGANFDMSRSQLYKLREAVNGTMSDMELMTLANQALSLGVVDNIDDMAELFDTAQRLGKGLGQDTKGAVESLTTGIGRNSIQMLDNLGIIVNSEQAYDDYKIKIGATNRALTEQEKKLAFNEAALTKATEAVKLLGDEQLSTSEQIDQTTNLIERELTTSWTFWVNRANDLVQMLGLTSQDSAEITSNSWVAAMNEMENIRGFDAAANEVVGAMERIHLANPVGDFEAFKEKLDEAMGLEGTQKIHTFMKLFETFANKQRESNELTFDEMAFLGVYLGSLRDIAQIESLALKTKEATNKVMAETPLVLQDTTDRYMPFLDAQQRDISNREQLEKQRAKEKKDAEDLLKTKIASEKLLQRQIDMSIAAGLVERDTAKAVSVASAAYISDHIKKIVAKYIFDAFGELGFAGGLGAVATGAAFGSLVGKTINSVAAADGFDGIVTEPTMFLAGEAGAEYVDIDPLTNEGNNKSKGINITFTGNVMSQEFIESEAIPMIKNAIRKGGDIGIG